MPFRDLRQFMDGLESQGELKRVGIEVDWDLEIGAISRRGMDLRGPAILFERVKGYPKGFRVLANLLTATKPVVQGRYALALDLPKETSTLNLIEEFKSRVHRPIPPKIVDDGPCKENILRGDQVDLYRFPTPLIHDGDGGRFIGTWHIDVTQDLDSYEMNWGMYRHQILDSKTLAVLIVAGWHGGVIHQKHEQRGKPMPIAIAIGTEPISTIVAGTDFDHPPSEAEYAGALRGEPVELVKCETVDLYVPATSEIVIEGIVKPHERMEEGPFGEYTGYDAGGVDERPIVHVTCITHRHDPILAMSNMGKPWDEYSVISSIGISGNLALELERRGFSFKSLYVPPPATGIIVSAKPSFAGYTHTLASAIWSTQAGRYNSHLIIVGEDVDVTNMEDVYWCLVTRLHPRDGLTVEGGIPCHMCIPYLTPEERADECRGYRVLFDATFPKEWPPEKTPKIIDWEHAWPPQVKEKILANWKEYGFEE